MGIASCGNWEAIAGRCRAHALRAQDLPACNRLIGFEIQDAGAAELWRRALPILFREGAMYGALVEDLSGPDPAPVACGLGLFISAALLSAVAQSPRRSLDGLIGDHLLNNRSSVLRPRDIGVGNATCGVHLFLLMAFEDRIRGTDCMHCAWHALARLGSSMHAGYRLASVTNRVSYGDDIRVVLAAAGSRVVNPSEVKPEALISRCKLDGPVILSHTREEALCATGTWASTLFDYTPPRFRLTFPEQAMLRLALTGTPDAEVARELNWSISSVKKRWEDIYDRVADVAPMLLSDAVEHEPEAKRGPEKRRRLLRYLTSHIEELRPFDWTMQPRNGSPAPRHPRE